MSNKDIEEDIKQLQDLKSDRESFVTGDKEHDEIFLKDIQAIENILADRERLEKENNNIKKILKRDIRECRSGVITTQGNKQRKELTGAQRRHIASLSGRQNEAIRILNILEGKEKRNGIKHAKQKRFVGRNNGK